MIAEGKPGPKWWRLYRQGRANAKLRAVLKAWETNSAKLVQREMAFMRAYQNYHMSLGWIDIGYHKVLFPSGNVYLGRAWNTYGAHAINGNHMPGYAIAGNYEVHRPTQKALAALKKLIARDGVKTLLPHGGIRGNATACPGKYLRSALGL